MQQLLKKAPGDFAADYLSIVQQEYGEAALLYNIIVHHSYLTPETLGIGLLEYAYACADVVGELRRYALDALRNGQLDLANHTLEEMDEIFTHPDSPFFKSAIPITVDALPYIEFSEFLKELASSGEGAVPTGLQTPAPQQALTEPTFLKELNTLQGGEQKPEEVFTAHNLYEASRGNKPAFLGEHFTPWASGVEKSVKDLFYEPGTPRLEGVKPSTLAS
jgi:hypothetical protein